jgi:hypothetical protein
MALGLLGDRIFLTATDIQKLKTQLPKAMGILGKHDVTDARQQRMMSKKCNRGQLYLKVPLPLMRSIMSKRHAG